MKLITERAELVALARELGVRPDWHEPDEQGITARFDGTDGDFDNAGHWPMIKGHGYDHNELGGPRRGEMAIILSREVQDRDDHPGAEARRGPDIAAVNVATLFAWASADVPALQRHIADLERRVAQLRTANAALRQALNAPEHLVEHLQAENAALHEALHGFPGPNKPGASEGRLIQCTCGPTHIPPCEYAS